jgi:DTW domain-containing protein YfiP
MREFCWTCHRCTNACFCAATLSFASSVDFALIVHPYEVRSTIGTAWILRRSISNMKWFRSKGLGLDEDQSFLKMVSAPDTVPLLLFPGANAFNLSRDSDEAWQGLVPKTKRPLFIVIDGTWTQAKAMLRQSPILSSLPRVSFETVKLSEYGFKKQPHPACLSSVEGVHRVIDVVDSRGWGKAPALGEHDQMIEIFRGMVKFQLGQKRSPRTHSHI